MPEPAHNASPSNEHRSEERARSAVTAKAEIVQLLASPVHRYEGRPADGPAPAPSDELVDHVEIRAGLGIVGDRYFGKPAHRDAAVTVMAEESLPPGASLVQARRNILLRGVAVDELVGKVLVLDSGEGAVRLAVRRPANPCAWMDATIGPGARDALRGKGGIRCAPLTDGTLRLGAVTVTIE
jgi:MOSC domain-containing protein YiiM